MGAKIDPLLHQTPPHDLSAEEALLSAIFINNDTLLDVTEILEPEDFYKGAHKKIYRVICELFTEEDPADLVTVVSALEKKNELEGVGGAAYLAIISDAAPVAINAIHYAKIIRDKSHLRQLISSSSSIIQKCMEDNEDVKDVMCFAENSVFQIAEKKVGGIIQNLGNLINANIDMLEARQNSDSNLLGHSTGYDNIDQLTSGLQSTDLIILAARPSMGKTALALNITRNVALGTNLPVVVFSLEMSAEQLSMRLLTSEARLDSGRLKGGLLSRTDWQNAMDSATMLNELPILIDDTTNLTPMDIRAKVRKIQQKHGQIGLIVIDYIQLMKSPIKSDRKDLEVAEISKALKSLAKETKSPVMVVSQLNRSLEQRADKRPIMSDLRESGALEQDADIIAFIYRDEVYNKEPDNPKKGTAEIIISKNRNGAIGTAYMHFQGQFTRFEALSPGSYNEQDFQEFSDENHGPQGGHDKQQPDMSDMHHSYNDQSIPDNFEHC